MGKAPGIYYYQQDSRLLYLTQPESTSTTSTNHHHQQLPQCLLSVPLNSLPARDHHPAARCRLCPSAVKHGSIKTRQAQLRTIDKIHHRTLSAWTDGCLTRLSACTSAHHHNHHTTPNALESAPANTTTQTCPASCTRHRAGSDSESRRLLFSALHWHRISSNHQPARLRVWPCARQPTHSWPHGAA